MDDHEEWHERWGDVWHPIKRTQMPQFWHSASPSRGAKWIEARVVHLVLLDESHSLLEQLHHTSRAPWGKENVVIVDM